MVIGTEMSVRVSVVMVVVVVVVVYLIVIDDIIEDFSHLSGEIKYPLSPDSYFAIFEFFL